jgi:hypothetical protein
VICTLDERPGIFIRDKPIISSEREYYILPQEFNWGKKFLVVGLKGPGTKTK